MKYKRSTQDLIWSEIIRRAVEVNCPVECGFELTSRCNFNCRMCYVHTQNCKEIIDQELSTAQWKDIFDQAINAGMQYALLTGGECILRADFKELYLYLYNKGIFVSVNSNASMFTAEYLDFFQQYPPHNIQITLYGTDDEVYSHVTGVPAFSRVNAAIDRLLSLGIHFTLVFTICKFNYQNLPGLLAFASDRQLQYKVSFDLIAPRSEKTDDYSLSLDEYIEVYRILHQCTSERSLEKRMDSEVPEPGGSLNEPKKYVACKAGRATAFINWQGIMLPCASVTDISANVLKLGYANAWHEINQRTVTAALPDKCNGCAYERKCTKCPAVRTGGILKTVCNENYCESMKRRYAEGLIRKL